MMENDRNFREFMVEKMKLDDLFDHRSFVAVKLKGCIRERGFTKVSLARKTGNLRVMVGKLFGGKFDNRRAFAGCGS